jgi:DNA-binding LacI/PurR family transcriptional regulator/DNA-binding transcriptional regulator YhcF (GntR family)
MITARRKVDKSDPIPRYLQVRRILEESIRSGQYGPGSRLPGEREIARDLNVSQMTVNKAVLALVQDGWLHRESGNGTFVRPDFRPPAPELLRIGFVSPISSDHILDDYYLGALFRGIQRTVANEAVSLSLLEVHEEEMFERLTASDLHGFLVAGISQRSIPELRRLQEADVRAVVMGASWEALPVPFVDSDNYGGAVSAVRHLIGLGHRRIAGIFAFMGSCNSQHRLKAFRETLSEHAIPLPDEYTLAFENADLLRGTPTERVRALLDGTKPAPTAFFCGGFQLVLEVMREIQREGHRVPQEISIVGFDDLTAAHHTSPPLTTVRQPLNEIGQRAMQKLLDWLRTGVPPRKEDVLPTQLIQRESTAAPVTAGIDA